MVDTPDVPPLTYRELRNTPGIVADRLAEGRPIPLMLEGEIRGVIFPTSATELGDLKRLWCRAGYQRARLGDADGTRYVRGDRGTRT